MNYQLRKWKISDAEDVAKCANNVKVANNLRDVFPHPYTLPDAKEYVESCVSNDESRQMCKAIVVNGIVVGSIGVFLGRDVYRKSAELGYWLAEEYWRRGIMTDAVKQICNATFEVFDVVRIFAEPFEHNMGSRGVLEKAGFSLEGIMKNGVCKNGEIFGYCMYALLKK